MSLIERFLAALVVGWGIGLLICLPWITAMLGVYKRWYIIPNYPGFSMHTAIYTWPWGSFFLTFPIIIFIEDDGLRQGILGAVAVIGCVLTFYMMIRPPRWIKPWWVRYLEDHYSQKQIFDQFCPKWLAYTQESEENAQRWHDYMDSEEGIEKMVSFAFGGPILPLTGQPVRRKKARGKAKKSRTRSRK